MLATTSVPTARAASSMRDDDIGPKTEGDGAVSVDEIISQVPNLPKDVIRRAIEELGAVYLMYWKRDGDTLRVAADYEVPSSVTSSARSRPSRIHAARQSFLLRPPPSRCAARPRKSSTATPSSTTSVMKGAAFMSASSAASGSIHCAGTHAMAIWERKMDEQDSRQSE